MARTNTATRGYSWRLIAVAIAAGLGLGLSKRLRSNWLAPRLEDRSAGSGGTPVRANADGVDQRTGAFGEARSTDEPKALQHARAREDGRGREAMSPTQIPWAGWKDILWRVYAEIGGDRVLAVGAGVVFFGLLAIFPTITALVSMYGLFTETSTIIGHLSFLESVMPPGAFDIVRDQVNRIISQGGGGLTFAFIFGLALALWSANAGIKAIFDALNVIYDEDEKRGFFKLNSISLSFTLGAIALFLLFVASVVVVPIVMNWFGLQGFWDSVVALLRWPAMLVVSLFAFSLLYRFGPSRDKAQWRWLSVGSLFGTIAWLAGSLLFSWYMQNFADYNATYGSLGAVIGLMMWMWLSTIAILVGAEINAEMEHQTARDTTTGLHKPLGGRGAAMADTVGEAKA